MYQNTHHATSQKLSDASLWERSQPSSHTARHLDQEQQQQQQHIESPMDSFSNGPCLSSLQEGWAPSTFTSSRSERSEKKQQRLEDFLDDDELEERGKTSLQLKVVNGGMLTSHW